MHTVLLSSEDAPRCGQVMWDVDGDALHVCVYDGRDKRVISVRVAMVDALLEIIAVLREVDRYGRSLPGTDRRDAGTAE